MHKYCLIKRPEDGLVLAFLYKTLTGRILLKIAINPLFSDVFRLYFDSPLSVPLIKPFVRRHRINAEEYEKKRYLSFNDFFKRKIATGKRKIDRVDSHLISPCDGALSAYEIKEESVFQIKGSQYHVADLLQNHELAKRYSNGTCLIFRLTPADYHRYCYIDHGKKGNNRTIAGKLHTVRKIAMARYHVYKQNAREYTVLDTRNFGHVIQVEVGALLIGRITNHHSNHNFERGEEKGMFEFGGSTIVLLLEANTACIDDEIIINTLAGRETHVKLGEKIGKAV